jgi:hypothetical protein
MKIPFVNFKENYKKQSTLNKSEKPVEVVMMFQSVDDCRNLLLKDKEK